jgi:hypothetical protein
VLLLTSLTLLLLGGGAMAKVVETAPSKASVSRAGQDQLLTAGAGLPAAAPAPAAVAPRTTTADGWVADPAQSWAVLIGIQHYDAPTHPTVGALGDVNVFHHLLDEAGWDDSHILVLTDQTATGSAIRNALGWLAQHSGPSTFSVFHYSGHVLQTSGHEFLWGVDNQFVRNDDFGTAVRAVQGRAWIDVAGCESAGFEEGLAGPQRLFTASSQSNQKSYEDPNFAESVWTWMSVDTGLLYHASSPAESPISIQQAVHAAQPAAAAYTAGQQPYGSQQPMVAGGTGDWYVGPGMAPLAPVGVGVHTN